MGVAVHGGAEDHVYGLVLDPDVDCGHQDHGVDVVGAGWSTRVSPRKRTR